MSSYFQNWLSYSFRPCCLVYCTESAKKIIAKNNLTPSEFLRPFGDFRGKTIKIQFNEKEKEPTTIDNFILDFYYVAKFKQIDKNKIINYLTTMLKINSPTWNLSSPLITKGYVEPFKTKLKQYYSTPWFKEFESTLIECLYFDEYELYQQPLINIFIVSIEEKNSVINEHLGKHNPKLINEKKYDIPNESIILTLNDCKDHSLTADQLEKSKSRFAMFKNYYIINWDINVPPYSNQNEGEQKKISENFKKYLHRTDIYNKDDENYNNYQKKQYGMYINANCYKKYKEDFMNYFNNFFINKVLERITTYNATIKSNSGISRIFKKDEVNYYNKTKIYKFTQLERAYYNLGLLYFFFHNYDMANDTFKLLRGSLKEKSEKHKERVKELKAMCKFLQKKESNKEFNILAEMNVKGTNEQLLRTQLIAIKMFENQIKSGIKDFDYKYDYKVLIEKIFLHKITKLMERSNGNNTLLELFLPLLQEKLGVYYLIENKFRKYVCYMAFAGKNFAKLSQDLKQYALYTLSNLVYFIDHPSPSFTTIRIYFNRLLGEVCNALKYSEGSLKFYKNCLEFSCVTGVDAKDIQSSFLMYYLSIITQIKREKIICNNLDINELNIPQVDNASLFVLENDDYNIKQRAEELEVTDDKSWLVFNKYGESLTSDVYVDLDEVDLDHIKLIHDLTNQTNKVIANVHTDRYFYGNINQKLFVKCTIKNPLSTEIQVTSVKLFCQFIQGKASSSQKQNNNNTPTPTPTETPKVNENKINENETSTGENNNKVSDKRNSLETNININDKINNNETNNQDNNNMIQTSETPNPDQESQQHLPYTISEDSCNMKPGETKELELYVSSQVEGKIIVKGLEFLLFNECKIIHLFSKKLIPSLYYYCNKKKNFYSPGAASFVSSSGSSSDYESRNSSELTARMLNNNNIVIPRKNKIEYIISDFKNDLFVTFPMGTKVEAFLYQLFFFPIKLNNNSIQYKVRRYSIFIEECDKNKVKTFFNFITRDNQIKERFSSETILIPIIPLATGEIYIKILIKFIADRLKPIQVKRFLINIKAKESISFEVKEYCSNLNVDNDGKTYNKIDFNIKTNLRIRNDKEIKNLEMKEPVYNKELNLLNQKTYLITNNEIHKKFVFIKENVSNSNIETKYNLDFITNNINIENKEKEKENNENEKENSENNNKRPDKKKPKSSNENYIIDRFNKILNNSNGNITIFFPWVATCIISNEDVKKNKDKNDENENNSSNPKEIILQGLYPYKLQMENSEATKTLLTYLFNKYTELNITQKKIDEEKTLIKMILKLNKIGLASMGDKIDKYEIYAHGTQPQIIWLGSKKFIVKNNLDENTFKCRFNFITTLKGTIEINRISVLIYKKAEKEGGRYSTINISHITKPTSILIE